MNYRKRMILIVSSLLILLTALPATARDQVRFLSLVDGDSMYVEMGGRKKEIRLIGVDAPEHGQEYSSKAKTFSLRFCYAKTLTIEFDTKHKDRFGRLLVYLFDGQRMLNEELVKAGLALAVTYKPNVLYQRRFEAAEEWAMQQRNGFWLRDGLQQTPYEWRQSHKKK